MSYFAVGYFQNYDFREVCGPYLNRLGEVFFSWPGSLSCRPTGDFSQERLLSDLVWSREHGLRLDLLFNCNCYGERAISQELMGECDGILGALGRRGLFPELVTTTSPFVAWYLRRRYPGLEIRGSVNLRVHGTIGFEEVADLFDSFYVSREHQRDFGYLEHCRRWAEKNGRKLGLQVNSGCLRQCPYQQFHDNLHGHHRREQMEFGRTIGFEPFLCRRQFAAGKYEEILRGTWIRPEDCRHFEKYADVLKLSTRNVEFPERIIRAYATGEYHGNLLDLLDPHFHRAEQNVVFQNDAFPEEWAISGIAGECANNCTHCGRCATLLARVMGRP